MDVLYLLLLAIVPLISAEKSVKTPPSVVKLAPYVPEPPTDYDCIIFVNDKFNDTSAKQDALMTKITNALADIGSKVNNIEAKAGIYFSPEFPDKAFIYSPTGPLNDDIADSRSISNAGRAGAELAAKANKKKPLLVVGPMNTAPKDAPWSPVHLKDLNAVLGAFYGLYVPLQLREAHEERASKYEQLYLYDPKNNDLKWVVDKALAIENGRVIARDLCGADPERITPTAFVTYVQTMLNPEIKIENEALSNESYPMISLIQRASMNHERFQGSVLHLDYTNPSANKSLYLLGLGNTYDTGGADLRVSGTMVGMSRRKCGAAAVVGLMVTARELKANINLYARLAIVRNNIGSKSFTCDTIIKANSGKRIRIGFTQADGRMILADLLFHAKNEALAKKDTHKHIFTVATLTTHVVKAYKYMVGIMDNGPAAKEQTAENLQKAGDKVADIGEISVIRKEDYDFNLNTLETEDLVQSTNGADDGTKRGHQIAFAFMVQASGMTEHGLSAAPDQQLPYTHLDVSGSAGVLDIMPTASPLNMLTMQYLITDKPKTPESLQ